MTPLERRASASLALVFALRMLGLFLVLPVFAIEARQYPGGHDPAWVGLAMGLYGLTQALMQMPLGLASDRLGRKRVILIGLAVFALGSVVAALASGIVGLAIGRALQGAGAVSAAVTALLADQTRDAVRTKGMALVGASIGLTFAVSLMLAPPLAGWIGLSGIFGLTALLALAGMAAVVWITPAEPARHTDLPRGRLADVALHPKLWRLDLGVFVLHAVQMAMWVAVPGMLLQAGLATADQWRVYLPAVLASFLLMGGLFALEQRGHLRQVLRAAVALLAVVQLALAWLAMQTPSLWVVGAVLFLFFTSFNVLEASQPSLISRLAPPQARGAALGMYNTLQSLGLFAGGALGGLLIKLLGPVGLFATTLVLALVWLLLAWQQPMPARG
ncbi:MFS transporter [Comamonas serinivorans]|uniref:MFS transporter n=1 Tax=Comamonas serinivorans TaxID=1082851 RepID=A0A1Y0ERV4_9BURK|nr:MFS transporter [Comamonas serinivorans]ARU06228.1 MFS transporter [Comamonas serinivorans]